MKYDGISDKWISDGLNAERQPYEAIMLWEVEVQSRISQPDGDDEKSRFVKDSLGISKKDVW